jgi:hypothetical protein
MRGDGCARYTTTDDGDVELHDQPPQR